MILSQTAYAVDVGIQSSFLASGGTGPYSYAVTPGGAGGSIDATTGVYTAPSTYPPEAKHRFDTIVVTDSLAATASADVLVGPPLLLFLEVLKREMGLPWDHCYLWDQKLPQPTDSDLYIAVSVMRAKPFGNTNRGVSTVGGMESEAYVSMLATLGVDLISRGPDARDRKEEILLALNSDYAQLQQNRNSFSFGRLPALGEFVNLSMVDGAAIPYRFHLAFNMQYAYRKNAPISYYDDFEHETYTNP